MEEFFVNKQYDDTENHIKFFVFRKLVRKYENVPWPNILAFVGTDLFVQP